MTTLCTEYFIFVSKFPNVHSSMFYAAISRGYIYISRWVSFLRYPLLIFFEGTRWWLAIWEIFQVCIGVAALLVLHLIFRSVFISLFEVLQLVWTSKGRKILRLNCRLRYATTYGEWVEVEKEKNELTGDTENIDAECIDGVDLAALKQHTDDMKFAREMHNCKEIAFLLRVALHRNFCGLRNPALYAYSPLKVHRIVEEFYEEVIAAITELDNSVTYEQPKNEQEMHVIKFMTLISDLRLSIGRTAFCLSGGGGLSLYHLGVIQCLIKENLLPNVVSGTSGGSIIAALLATMKDEEFTDLFSDNNKLQTYQGLAPPMIEQFKSFIKTGYFFDHQKFCDFIRCLIGNYTFNEAFKKTGRFVSITTTQAGKRAYGDPLVCNVINTPNVLIWSAVVASCSLPLILPPMILYVRVDMQTKQHISRRTNRKKYAYNENGNVTLLDTNKKSKLLYDRAPLLYESPYISKFNYLNNISSAHINNKFVKINSSPIKLNRASVYESVNNIKDWSDVNHEPSDLFRLNEGQSHEDDKSSINLSVRKNENEQLYDLKNDIIDYKTMRKCLKKSVQLLKLEESNTEYMPWQKVSDLEKNVTRPQNNETIRKVKSSFNANIEDKETYSSNNSTINSFSNATTADTLPFACLDATPKKIQTTLQSFSDKLINNEEEQNVTLLSDEKETMRKYIPYHDYILYDHIQSEYVNSDIEYDESCGLRSYAPEDMRFVDGSILQDIPYNELQTLFNVKSFLVSQVNPHFTPFIQNIQGYSQKTQWYYKLLDKLWNYITIDLRNRYARLLLLSIVPAIKGQDISPFLMQTAEGHCTIVPTSPSDFWRITKTPTPREIINAIDQGQRKTWQYIIRIKHMLCIERKLKSVWQKHALELQARKYVHNKKTIIT